MEPSTEREAPASAAQRSLSDLLPAATASAEEMQTLGAKMAGGLGPGDVVALYGNLGAGKTQLVKGIGRGLGLDPRQVRSPTFTILHEHNIHASEWPVYHFDAYRINDPDELFELGYEDYFYGEGLCLVEWADRVETLLPSDTIRLRLSHRGGDRRLIELKGGMQE